MSAVFFLKKSIYSLIINVLMLTFTIGNIAYAYVVNHASILPLNKRFYFLVADSTHVETSAHFAVLSGGAGYLLEYNDNGEWVRLRYYTESMLMGHELSEWQYVMNGTKEGETVQTICHRAPFVLFTENVLDELVPGLYRLVMCVGPNKYYAEFTLEE